MWINLLENTRNLNNQGKSVLLMDNFSLTHKLSQASHTQHSYTHRVIMWTTL